MSPAGLRHAEFSLRALPIVQQLESLLRWRTTWLTERLPPLCPLSLGTEWVDMVNSSHNKHFSKWASSDDKLGHIECPTVFYSPSLWWCCPTKTLPSKGIEGAYRKKGFGNGADIIHKSDVFSILHTAGHVQLLHIFSQNLPQIIMLSLQFQSHIWLYMS